MPDHRTPLASSVCRVLEPHRLRVGVEDTATLVAPGRRIGVLSLEVGAGGVEEDQIDLQVEQVRDHVEHPARYLVLDPDQPVHRPVAGVIEHGVVAAGQPGQVHIVRGPAGGGQLRRRRQRPIGDQREQHPLHHQVPAGPGREPAYSVSIPNRRHNPSSSHAPPTGRDSTNTSPGNDSARP
jgi:hypothetical protein